jgi:uncharacterized protein
MRRSERPTTDGELRAPERTGGRRFDAFELAQQRGTVRGDVDAADLPRIADALSDEGGRVSYVIVGTCDAADRPALEVSVEGALSLTCQRCLQPMSWSVAQRTLVLLARDERELARLDESDEHEVVLADAPLDALVLVEDELLLTMPYAPRHPDGESASCAPATGDERTDSNGASPFRALAEMQAARVPGRGKRPRR